MKARFAAPLVLATAIALGTSGCTFISPQATQLEYDVSDGVGASVGAIDIRNAILISDNGETANLLVALVNNSTESHTVQIQYETGSRRVSDEVEVPAGERLDLGIPGGELFILRDIETIPGALFPVYFQYGDEPGAEVKVPVLTTALPEYAGYGPREVVLEEALDIDIPGGGEKDQNAEDAERAQGPDENKNIDETR